MPSILITGANRGLGLGFVRKAAGEGWRVFAACRVPDDAKELRTVKGDVRIIRIDVADSGPGISKIASILSGTYRSKTGLGLGIVGCKRLMDEFEIDTAPGRGTRVSMTKLVP